MDQHQFSVVEKIYRDHKDHIYNYIQRLCNDAELSNDIVQTTFIKLLSDPNIVGVEHLKAYLFTVARNTLFDEMKRKKPVYFENSEQAELAAGNDDISLHDQAEEQVLAKAVDKAIAHMPEKFRELMLLRYTEDLSIQEIADITQRNISDIKVNLHRARLAFENRFTATMYTKVATSRKRCDTLIGMIASYGDNDIPMGEIPKIETHIAKCANCNEDAAQMKRRRELFALLPLLVAPEVWHDIMKEARAADMTQDAGATSSHHSAAAKTTANSVNSAIKISAVKIASMTAVVLTVVVSSIVLWQRVPVNNPLPVSVPDKPTNMTTPPPSNPPPSGASSPSAPSPATQPSSSATNTPNLAANNVASQNPVSTNNSTQGTSAVSSPPPATPSTQIAKVTPPSNVAQTSAANPVSQSGFWYYDGPPLTTTVENTAADGSDTEINVIYKSRLGIRTESTSQADGKKHILMANFTRRKGYILDPKHQVYVDLKVDDNGNSTIFPVFNDESTDSLLDKKPCEKYDLSRRLGSESIDGKSAEKWGCMSSKNGNSTVQWYDPARKLVIGEEDSENGKSVLKTVIEQPIAQSTYEIPAGYKQISIREYYALENPTQEVSYDNAMAIMAVARCTPDCVKKIQECHVKLQPQCENAGDKAACYSSCDSAYTACLAKCQKPVFAAPTQATPK